MTTFATIDAMRPAKQAERPDGRRRTCGEPRPRMRPPALEGDMRTHVADHK
jgi:hypothetical protein